MANDVNVTSGHINAVLTAARVGAGINSDLVIPALALAFSAACRAGKVNRWDAVRFIKQALDAPFEMAITPLEQPPPGMH